MLNCFFSLGLYLPDIKSVTVMKSNQGDIFWIYLFFHATCLLLLSYFKQNCCVFTNFIENPNYEISWKWVQLQSLWYIYTDRQTLQRHFSNPNVPKPGRTEQAHNEMEGIHLAKDGERLVPVNTVISSQLTWKAEKCLPRWATNRGHFYMKIIKPRTLPNEITAV
jgi:hypothetical protein